jgi:hypothetical protein
MRAFFDPAFAASPIGRGVLFDSKVGLGLQVGLARPARSDREGDLSDQAGEDKRAAQAVALALIRQEKATEADERNERHSDLTSGIHVMFLRACRP